MVQLYAHLNPDRGNERAGCESRTRGRRDSHKSRRTRAAGVTRWEQQTRGQSEGEAADRAWPVGPASRRERRKVAFASDGRAKSGILSPRRQKAERISDVAGHTFAHRMNRPLDSEHCVETQTEQMEEARRNQSLRPSRGNAWKARGRNREGKALLGL